MAETTFPFAEKETEEGGAALLLGGLGIGAALLALGIGMSMSAKPENGGSVLPDDPVVDYTPPSAGNIYETNEVCYDVEVQTLNGIAGIVGPGDGTGDVVVVNI